MTTQEIVRASLSAITASGLDYVVVGAFATGHYAFPRATKDADFVVAAPLAAIGLIAPHFPASFHVDPQPQMEMLTGTYQWIVEVDGTEFRVEIFHLGGDPHHELIFRRRVELEMPEFGGKVWLPTAEDLVIQKLRWGPGERFRRRAQYSRRAKRSDRLRAHRDVVRAPRDAGTAGGSARGNSAGAVNGLSRGKDRQAGAQGRGRRCSPASSEK